MGSPPYVTPYTNQTVAQVLLLYLGLEGVNKIFGIPGGGLANFLVELKNQKQNFEYIICRHETGAAYMADGYFRATGKLGVVAVTSGPGATNALTGAMTAQNDGSGLLVITGEVSEQFYGKGYLQEGTDTDLDVQAIYQASACYSAEISDQSEAITLIEQALRDAMSIPRGMAHLSLPNNVPTETVMTPPPPAHPVFQYPPPTPPPASPTINMPSSPANYRATPAGVDDELVYQALEQLLACKRPLIFLGSGCRESLRNDSIRERLVAFVERYAIPVMTTPDGKGVFPEDHQLSLRIYGFASNTWAPMWMKQQPTPYDGLLVLGTSLRGLSCNSFNPMLIPNNNGPFIQVDLDQQAIGRSFPVTLGIVADVGAFIWHMGDPEVMRKFPPNTADVDARQAEVASIQQNSPYYDQSQYDSTASPIEPAAIVRVLQKTLPEDSMIFLDAGNAVGWGIHYFTIKAPQQIHSSLAMGPMGFAAAGVVGAKIGTPDKTCVALVGDGGFMMHGSEVSTAQAYGVGVIMIVLKDDDLHMVSQGMQYLYYQPDDPWDSLYRLGSPDLVKIAEGFGADAYRIKSPAELEALMPQVIAAADNKDKPQVIVAEINQASIVPYFAPPYPPPPAPPPQK